MNSSNSRASSNAATGSSNGRLLGERRRLVRGQDRANTGGHRCRGLSARLRDFASPYGPWSPGKPIPSLPATDFCRTRYQRLRTQPGSR
jgi:hypothetical protein